MPSRSTPESGAGSSHDVATARHRFAIALALKGKVPPPVPPHVAKDVRESRRLHDLLHEQDVSGFAGIVQGEHAQNLLGEVAAATVQIVIAQHEAQRFQRQIIAATRVAEDVTPATGLFHSVAVTTGDG